MGDGVSTGGGNAVWFDPVALAPWVMLLVAYLRQLLGRMTGRPVPGVYAPVLAVVCGPAVTVGAWMMGWLPATATWSDAVQVGLRAAIAAMGGYSGIKALIDAARDGGVVGERTGGNGRGG